VLGDFFGGETCWFRNKTIHNWLMRPFLLANETDVPSPISVGKKICIHHSSCNHQPSIATHVLTLGG
jgi:hypothetical protein